MAKFSKVIDGRKLIGDAQTPDIEDLAVTTAKLAAGAVTIAKLVNPKLLYIGLYDYAEYDRSVYDF